jgi:hypothetical protein
MAAVDLSLRESTDTFTTTNSNADTVLADTFAAMTGSGGAVAATQQPVRTVGVAVDAFLARPDLAVSSRRSYAQTLNRLAADIGAGRAIATLDADALDVAA